MLKPTEIHATFTRFYRGVEIHIFQRGDGRNAYVKQILMEDEPEATYVEPAMVVDKEVAQQLFDDLYHCGFRPSVDVSGSTPAAIEAHLKDMRTIAFHQLKIPIDQK